MKGVSKYSLQRTMIIYFLLVCFASLLVGIEFIVETNGPQLREELLSNFENYSNKKISADILFQPIDRLRSKAILMIAVVLFVMIIVLMMFIKNITEPLQHMIKVAQKISKGDLSYTVEINANNELSELGNVINEMSCNIQEITLLSKNLCDSGEDFATKTSSVLLKPEIGKADVELIKLHLEIFRSKFETMAYLINCFNFYSLRDSSDD